MCAKRTLSKEEFEAHLHEQIAFLEASSSSFDGGFEGEAKRLAVTLRVLFHDTQHSKSLLGQLDKLGGPFLDTAFPVEPHSLMTHGGLVFIILGGTTTRYVAMLDDVPEIRSKNFSEWWNAPVFIDSSRRELSRKQLVLTAANQDGGAHVDPGLEEVYDDLSRKNSLGWVAIDGPDKRAMQGPEKAAIRQIAHEALKSLNPNYTKMPEHKGGIIVGGSIITSQPFSEFGRAQNLSSRPFGNRKIGRNERCPCGSGVKYKSCHGKNLE